MRIETGRLTLCELTRDMAQVISENSLDDDMRRFLPDEVFETKEEAHQTIEYLISQYGRFEGPILYAILTRAGDNIGYVELVPVDEGWEIGYHIAKKYAGNGYATEAVTAFLPVIAEMVGVSRIYGICLKENTASVRVLEHCGFVKYFEGTGLYQGAEREIVRTVWNRA